MIINRTLYAQVPNTEDTLWKLMGAPRGGVLVIIENFDEANDIIYKFQESNDGSTWTDKTFRTVDDDEAISFIVPAGSAHTIKVTMSTLLIRLRASGNAPAALGISYSTSHSPDAQVEIVA